MPANAISEILLDFALLAKTSNQSSNWVWLGVAAGIGAAWYGLSQWNKLRKPAGADTTSPKGLLAELCAAHQLTRPERAALNEAAAAARINDPALLFIDPRHLRTLAESRGANTPAYTALAQKLFG